jgi:hypothetical protein
MITDRERWLMRQAVGATTYYKSIDDWLDEVISDSGHTVADHLDYDADHLPPSKEGIA